MPTYALILSPDTDLDARACGGAERIALQLASSAPLSTQCTVYARSSAGRGSPFQGVTLFATGREYSAALPDVLGRADATVFWNFVPPVETLRACSCPCVFFCHYRRPDEWDITTAHLRQIRHCFFHSCWLRRAFVRHFGRTVCSSCVRAAVDPEQFVGRHPRQPGLIAFAGAFIVEKGVQDARAAFEVYRTRDPKARLWLIGDADLWGTGIGTPVRASTLNGHGVELKGRVAYEDMATLWSTASVMLMPSHYAECLPLSTVEAMSSGCRVVASDVRGNRELLVEGKHGLLFPVGNVAALAAQIARAVRDAAMRHKEWQTQARKRAALFSWRSGAWRLTRVLESLVCS